MAVVGEVTNNLLGLQQLAAGRQSMEAQARQAEDNRIASESLRKYQSSLQSGAPDYEALNEALSWYKGKNLEKEVRSKVLKELKGQEKRLSPKRSEHAVAKKPDRKSVV